MTDRVQLFRNGILVYDNVAEFSTPITPVPLPGPTPTPGPVTVPAFDAGVLAIDGQPYDFGVGMTSFRLPVEGGKRYMLETAECYKPVTVFVKRADGSDVLPPVFDRGGHAYVYFQAQDTGDYSVAVNATEQGGHIERHTS